MAKPSSHLTSHLGKARGLGSAKDGTSHWWWQRVTAVLMIPLMLWFVYSFVGTMVGASREGAAAWFASPVNSIALLALLTAMFYHSRLGLQVVIEDYVHGHGKKIFLLFTINFFAFAMIIMSWLAILKLHLMGI